MINTTRILIVLSVKIDLFPVIVKGYHNCNICQKKSQYDIFYLSFMPDVLFATFLSILCGPNLFV